MYAIVEVGGRQHVMEPDTVIKVDKLDAETDEEISLVKVLAIKDDEGNLRVGAPYLDDASVEARVVRQDRAPKITVMKFKAKNNYLRKNGHRQHFTQLKVTEIRG